jgi:hypothetical protein
VLNIAYLATYLKREEPLYMDRKSLTIVAVFKNYWLLQLLYSIASNGCILPTVQPG